MANDLKQSLPKLMSSNGAKKFYFAYAAGKRKDGKGDGELLVRGAKPKKTEIEGEMADCKEVVEGVCWTSKNGDGTVYMQGKGKKLSTMLVSKIALTAKRITGRQYDFQVPSEEEEARVANVAEGDGAPGTDGDGTAPTPEVQETAPTPEVKETAPTPEVKETAPTPEVKETIPKAPPPDGLKAPSAGKELQARLKGLLSRQQALLAKNPALKSKLAPTSLPATTLVSTFKPGASVEAVTAALDNLEAALVAGEAEAPAPGAGKSVKEMAAELDARVAKEELAAEYKARLAEWTPAIKLAMGAKGKNAAGIAKRLSQATALSKPGGDYAQALKILGEAFALSSGEAPTEAKVEAPSPKVEEKTVDPKAGKEEEESEVETPDPKAQKEETPDPKAQKEAETPDPKAKKEVEVPDPQAEKEDEEETPDPKVKKEEVPDPKGEKEEEKEAPDPKGKVETPDPKGEKKEDDAPEPKGEKEEETPDPKAGGKPQKTEAPEGSPRANRKEAARLRKEFEGLQPRMEAAIESHPDRKGELETPYKAFLKQISLRGAGASLADAEKSLGEIRAFLDDVESEGKEEEGEGEDGKKKKKPKDFTTKFKETKELLKQLPEDDPATEDLLDQMEDLEFAVKMEALWNMEGELAPDKVETLKAIKTEAKEILGDARKPVKVSDEEEKEGEDGDDEPKDKTDDDDAKGEGKDDDAKDEDDEKGEKELEEEVEVSIADGLRAMKDAVKKLKDDNPLTKGVQTTLAGFEDRLTSEKKLVEQGMLDEKDLEATNKAVLKDLKKEIEAAQQFNEAVKETRRIIGEMPKTDPVQGILQNALDNELARLQATGGVGQPTAVVKFMNDLERQAKERLSVTKMADRLTGEIGKLAGENPFRSQLQNRLTNAVASANPNNTTEIAGLLTSIQQDIKNAEILETKFTELTAAPDKFVGAEANDPLRNELAARAASMQRGAGTMRISESFGEIMKMIAQEEKAVASAVEYWTKAGEVSAAIDGLGEEAAEEFTAQFQALGKMIATVAQIPTGLKELNALLAKIKAAPDESKETEKEEKDDKGKKEKKAKKEEKSEKEEKPKKEKGEKEEKKAKKEKGESKSTEKEE